MRSLEDVLKDLHDAEKEYKEKCEKYGIEEKQKRKIKVDEQKVQEVISEDENKEG